MIEIALHNFPFDEGTDISLNGIPVRAKYLHRDALWRGIFPEALHVCRSLGNARLIRLPTHELSWDTS